MARSIDELLQMAQPPAETPVGGDIDIDRLLRMASERPATLGEERPAGELRDTGSEAAINGRGPLTRGLASTYERVAQVAGLPGETVNAILNVIGAQPDYQQGTATEAVRRAMESMGLDLGRHDPNDFVKKLGAGSVDALIMLAGIRGLAPSMAGRPANSPIGSAPRAATAPGRIAQDIGEQALQRPVTTAAQAVGSTPGMIVGEDLGGRLGERIAGRPGRAVGETLGGMVGGGVTGALTEGVGRTTRVIPSTEALPSNIAARPNPFISATADEQGSINVASAAIRQEVADIDAAIERAIRGINPSGQSGPEASARAQMALQRVARHAEEVETNLWQRIPRNSIIDVEPTINEMLAQRTQFSHVSPEWTWDNASAWRLMMNAGETAERMGHPRGFMMTADDALKFRSLMLQDARRANSQNPDIRNERLRDGLRGLQSQLLNDIEHSLPGDMTVAEARAFSRELNDRFTRGPLGRVLATDSGGETRVAGQQMVPNLLENERGMSQLYRATRPMPTGQGLGHLTGRQERNALRRAGDDAIRAQYADIADNAVNARGEFNTGAAVRQAGRFNRENERLVRDWTSVHHDMERTTNFIQQELVHQNEITNSYVARALKQDPQRAINTILNSPRPEQEVERYLQLVGNNQRAVEGLRSMFVTGLGRQARQDPTAMLAQVTENGPLRFAAETLLAGDYPRFIQLLEAVSAVQRGDITRVRQAGVAVGSVLSRVMGLHFGHIVAGALAGNTGAGTLSLPARMANNFAAKFNNFVSMGEPAQVLQKMLVDPDYEALMLSRVPNSLREARDLARRQQVWMRRILSARGSVGQGVLDNGQALQERDEQR